MLSWKLMKATERACRNVCEGEEVASHYNERLSSFNRLRLWTEGFIAGWLQDEDCRLMSERLRFRKIISWLRRKLR